MPQRHGDFFILDANLAEPIIDVKTRLQLPQRVGQAPLQVPRQFLFDLLVQDSPPLRVSFGGSKTVRRARPRLDLASGEATRQVVNR
jgi:hypothetical protein